MESYGLLVTAAAARPRSPSLLFKPPDWCAGLEQSMVMLFVLSLRLALAQLYTAAALRGRSED